MKQKPSEFSIMIRDSLRSGVRKARAEHFAKGLPVVYMKNGKIHYEYPPGKGPKNTSRKSDTD